MTVATELIRRHGYASTSVDDICTRAKVTKGAFFHHFATKDALVEACLGQWDAGAATMEAQAPFQAAADPRGRVLGYMDFYIGLFDNPAMLKSCLAGTTVQEVADTNLLLRDAANLCFVGAGRRFTALLDEACAGARPAVDTSALAGLWMATIQGSLILYKASRDETLMRRNLEQVKTWIAAQLPSRRRARSASSRRRP